MKNPDPALPISTQPPRSPVQLQELIRETAYELWEQRGREDGRDFDDWVTAEWEVTRNGKA
jgi:Protein of unknown function (DUF2934)